MQNDLQTMKRKKNGTHSYLTPKITTTFTANIFNAEIVVI